MESRQAASPFVTPLGGLYCLSLTLHKHTASLAHTSHAVCPAVCIHPQAHGPIFFPSSTDIHT